MMDSMSKSKNKPEVQKLYWDKNKAKYNAKKRERYATDLAYRKKILKKKKDWFLKNPEKYQIQKDKRSQRRLKLRFSILERDGFRCGYCGKKADSTNLHIDHIIPKSKGGTNHPDNLRTSCIECNLGKSDVLLNISK